MTDHFTPLPTELILLIISHIPLSHLQSAVYALSRCIRDPIPSRYLFECVQLTRSDQAPKLYRRLRNTSDDAPALVENFWLRTWEADAEIVINSLRLLSNLRSLTLWVGPRNFGPEHLEEVFKSPAPKVEHISLRFRPYVMQASYLQFLKGAYFDSTLLRLASWPSSQIKTLSIVQDTLSSELAHRLNPQQRFAQPLVFFRLDHSIGQLIQSSFFAAVTSFRLRIPSRAICRSFAGRILPGLQYLDLSTCALSLRELDTLLAPFPSLQHLVLDDCTTFQDELERGDWAALGKKLALIGVVRAKEREKRLKTWLESNYVAEDSNQTDTPTQVVAVPVVDVRPQRSKKGRKGLATAGISLREPSTSQTAAPPSNRAPVTIPKMRVVPSYPRLHSFSTTLARTPRGEARRASVEAEFKNGWEEGITQLEATRARLRQFPLNGVRLFVIGDDSYTLDEGRDGFDGLEDYDDSANNLEQGVLEGARMVVPTLCLAGDDRSGAHVPNCGHRLGWRIWEFEDEAS